ncbi:hypothetical protein DFH29DRAFT_365718 [Suillus ampliporus]|nr:hypothetical protein DFH29DRAFT_365718 [Suillus ampliporus]
MEFIMSQSNTLKLNCWAVGDDPNCVFPVKIESTETVGDLKEVIQDKMKHESNPFDAKSLDLWKVDINLKEDSHLLEILVAEFGGVLQGGYKLAGWIPLYELFTDAPEDRHLHIIVQRPLKGSCGPLSSSAPSKKKIFIELPQPRMLATTSTSTHASASANSDNKPRKVATTSTRASTDNTNQPRRVATTSTRASAADNQPRMVATTSTRASADNKPRKVATTSTRASTDDEPVADEEKGEIDHVHPCARCAVTNNKCVGKKGSRCKICARAKKACSMVIRTKATAVSGSRARKRKAESNAGA